MAAYAKVSRPAIEAAGGRVLARGMPAAAFEHGQMERVVLIEFDSVERAKAAYASPAYQAAHVDFSLSEGQSSRASTSSSLPKKRGQPALAPW